ncbi:unnamed protein product [Sphagnum balticum]
MEELLAKCCWSLDSWKSKTALQQPTYPEPQALEGVLNTLESFPPLCVLEKPGVWTRGWEALLFEEPFCCKVGIVLRASRSSMPTTLGTPSEFCCRWELSSC